MQIPVIRGTIDRRILVNYRVDPEVMQRHLPPPFRPQLVDGFAIAGICLIRLKAVRPRFLPCGIGSENAAHRIAAEWDIDGQTRRGVYIPRRDTNSRLNHYAGGRLFPGIHHLAKFTVEETDDYFHVELHSNDSQTHVDVRARIAEDLPADSIFNSVDEASNFFAAGSLGYSPSSRMNHYDGLSLQCESWNVEPLVVEQIYSSYFADPTLFPQGSVQFDCALLMRGIDHQWHGERELFCPALKS